MALPPPAAKGIAAALNGLARAGSHAVLAIDVSGSMQANLESEAFRTALEAAVECGEIRSYRRRFRPRDRVLDDGGAFSWDELVGWAGGTTDIQSALKRYQSRLRDILLFTDDEGAEQVAQSGWVILGIAKAPDFDIVIPGISGT